MKIANLMVIFSSATSGFVYDQSIIYNYPPQGSANPALEQG